MIASVNLPTRRKYKSFSPRSRPQIIVPADMAAYERLTNDVYVHGSVSLALAMAQETGIALKEDVTGPENILFAGASVHLSARKSYRLGQ